MPKTVSSYMIRNYEERDADQIGQFNFLSMLFYRFNKDFVAENIFCAVGEDGTVLGAGHLEPDQTWLQIETSDLDFPADYVYKLNLDISLNPQYDFSVELLDDLYGALLGRACDLKNCYPDKNVRVVYTTGSDELEEMDYYFGKGFVVQRNHLIMKRDLTEDIPEVMVPTDSIKIVNWKMDTLVEQEKYLRAEAEGDASGVCWSLNRLQWTKQGSEWDTFTAFVGDRVVGSVMTWGLGEERSATENIFVVPDWRRRGVAKAVITEALKFLRSRGKTEATLGVFGENEKAIPLYLSLGYKMMAVNMELGLDI